MPLPVDGNDSLRYGDRCEPKCGLAPRLEALPQFGKSPSSSRGVRDKSLTPPPLRNYHYHQPPVRLLVLSFVWKTLSCGRSFLFFAIL